MKKQLTIKEIQQEELQMLEKIVNFFDKNNIKYYLTHGTLLGAVRHQGFIPWDNDTDLTMFRSEFDKLIKVLKENNNKIDDNIEAISFELGNSTWPFLKFINKNIILDEEEGCDKNLWLDIFPLDNYIEKGTIKHIKLNLMRKLFFIKRNSVIKDNFKKYKFSKKIVAIMLKPISINTIIKKFIKYAKVNNLKDSKYVANNVWSTVSRKYNKEWFKDKKTKFENLEVNGMQGYDGFLKEEYGNYMELPPEDQRVSHNIKAYRRNYEEK